MLWVPPAVVWITSVVVSSTCESPRAFFSPRASGS